MSPTSRVPGLVELKSRLPWLSSMWFSMRAFLACASWSVVRYQARVRAARRPFTRMMAPTVGAETLVPAAFSNKVS
jgi:hypothetical protein